MAKLDERSNHRSRLLKADEERLERLLGGPQVAAYVLEIAGKRGRTFPEIAHLVGERFGPPGPDAGVVAEFVCRRKAGKNSLNRFARDPELAAWLTRNASAGRLDDIRAGCVREFGPYRAPSRSGLAVFLYAAGRRGRHGDQCYLDRDPEVAEWLRAEAPRHTQRDLRLACAARFGPARAPSRSSLSRFIRTSGCHCLDRSRLAQNPEVADWLRERARTLILTELHAACLAAFGAARTPSRTSIHRFLSRQPGGKLARRNTWMERNRELADWLMEHRHGMTLDALLAAAEVRFGAERLPSRSALARFLPALRPRRSVGPDRRRSHAP